MTRDELRERVLNIVDAVAGGAEVTIQNGHPRNHKLTDGATDAILALFGQAQGVPVEPSEEACKATEAQVRDEVIEGLAKTAEQDPFEMATANWLRSQKGQTND